MNEIRVSEMIYSPTRRVLSIDFPAWEEDSGGDIDNDGLDSHRGRIRPAHTTVVINGCPVHLEGIEVVQSDSDTQEVACETWEDELNALYQVYDPGEPFATADINGKQYVIYATPHGD